jgi:two-component system, OmpR family, sensor histidine kinase KdpD
MNMITSDQAVGLRIESVKRKEGLGSFLRARASSTSLLTLCASLAGVFLCTSLTLRFGLNLASVGFLFLVLVVLVAVYGGFWEATITSLAAVLSLNYFFVPPLHSLLVSDPKNWVALGAFEFTALVISRLSHQAQVRAAEAMAERRESERLYQTSREILLHDRSVEPGAFIASLFRERFQLGGALLFDAVSTNTYLSGSIAPDTEERTRGAYFQNSDTFDPDSNTWFCVLRIGVRPVGGLALCDCKMTPLVATALASLSALALERARSLEQEYRAEAARQTEQLRTAVLDALAHEFKTPLTTIWTASSGLLAADGLSEHQTELITLVDEQARNLNELASRLLGAAKLDSPDFRPRREPFVFSALVRAAIQNIDDQYRGRFQFNVPPLERPVLADRKLIATALDQLFDNAIKYSIPGSAIDVWIQESPVEVTLAVRNQGLIIAAADRERIFERFYRAAGTEHGPSGTGLGLSIVKRIADVHNGRVRVESKEDSGTTFFLALPIAP